MMGPPVSEVLNNRCGDRGLVGWWHFGLRLKALTLSSAANPTSETVVQQRDQCLVISSEPRTRSPHSWSLAQTKESGLEKQTDLDLNPAQQFFQCIAFEIGFLLDED